MTILPHAVSAGTRWKLHDYKQLGVSATRAAGIGAAKPPLLRCELPQLPHDELWLVHRMVVQTDSPTPTSARVYLNVTDPATLVDGTRAGNFDVADQASPIQVPGGSILICEWEDAEIGTTGSFNVQAVVLKGG